VILLSCSLLPHRAWAADAQKQLQEVEAALQEKKANAERMEKALGSSTADVTKIQEQLQQAAREEAQQQEALDALTAEMEDLRTKTAAARKVLATTARQGSGALGMMVRLWQLPAAAWWLYDGISLDQERRMMLLRGATEGLGQQAERLRRDLAEADTLQAQLDAKQQQLASARGALQERANLLNAMIAERQEMAKEHKAEHAALQREMAQLVSAAADLRGLLDKMARKPNVPTLKQGKVAVPEAAPVLAEVDRDGLLPVSGLVVRGYGTRDTYGITSRGLTLSAKAGARVVAPLAGKAVFVGPFKGYGTIVILQHPDGLHSLLAGFGQVDLALGQKVLAGEPIGLVGAAKGKNAPEIYFELRRDGEPINPLTVKRPPS
jgi:septal ring factor EnvC (AmiA/AmiB activator)